MGTVQLMEWNITRNRLGDQLGDSLSCGDTRGHQLADLGGADSHQGQLEREKTVGMPCVGIKLGLGQRGLSTISYTNYSKLKNVLPSVPLPESSKLVSPKEQVELGLRIFRLQCLQRVNREGRPRALQFTVIHHDARHIFKRQPGHGQPVNRRAQRPGFMPSLPGRNDVEGIQTELIQCRLR